MTKDECIKKIDEYIPKMREERRQELERLERQGTPRVGLDGQKLETDKKYDRIFKDLISQIDSK